MGGMHGQAFRGRRVRVDEGMVASAGIPVRGRRVALQPRIVEAEKAEVVQPETVAASGAAAGIGQLVEALIGGLGAKWDAMTQAMNEASSRPVRVEIPEHVTAAITAAATQVPQPIVVNVPEQPAPIVNVTVPEQQITVNVPEQPAPQVTVESPSVTVEAAPAPNVQVTVEQPAKLEVDAEPDRKVTFKRDAGGRIISAEVRDDT